MDICTQEHDSHCIQKKIILSSFVLNHVQYSSLLLATSNQNLNDTRKVVKLGHQKLFSQTKFDSSSNLKIKLGILPISLSFECRAATYCHSIIKKAA